jgi:hypothetical protein
MEEIKWFGSALLGVLATNNLGSCLALPEICQKFGLPQCQEDMRHGMSKSHVEPSQHCDITHWTHMEEMEWFDSALLGVLAATNLGSCMALAEICQTCVLPQCQEDMGHGKSEISQTEPSQHCNITHWTHMEEMEWLCRAPLGLLAANNLGFCLALVYKPKNTRFRVSLLFL